MASDAVCFWQVNPRLGLKPKSWFCGTLQANYLQCPESPSPFKDAPAPAASAVVVVGTATPEGGGEDLERYRRSGMVFKPSPTLGRVFRLLASLPV